MGGLLSCFSDAEETKRRPPQGRRRGGVTSSAMAATAALGSSERWRRPGRKEMSEEALIHEQALAAAAAIVLHHNGGGEGGAAAVPFDRSASVRYQGQGQKKQGLPRSSSSRPRSLADQVLQPQQLVNQDIRVDDLETKNIVLVHGGGFGAWCWYKTIALLEDSGFKVNAIDLAGSGIHSFDTNKITSISEYADPLTSFLKTLGDGEKVILVGHDFGGACISYAMEMFPLKVAKAIFLCAAMLTNGCSILDMFSQQNQESRVYFVSSYLKLNLRILKEIVPNCGNLEADTNDLLRQAQTFVYSNGKDQPPTAINLDKALSKELLFNQSPAKDVSLALVSMRPIPFAPTLEKLTLTDEKYGSVQRFYIETTEDNAIPLSLQQSLCESNPPEKIFRLKGSDHSPFFSKPQALHKLLVEIARIPSTQVS